MSVEAKKEDAENGGKDAFFNFLRSCEHSSNQCINDQTAKGNQSKKGNCDEYA